MDDDVIPAALVTAADVWCRLIKDKVLQPDSYDEDVVELVATQLPGSGALPTRMNFAGWTARDLLRAMSPAVNSFAGLLTDLLALYSEIAAKQATSTNLSLSYEFDEGDVFDQSLAQFRSAVATVGRAQAARGAFVLSPHGWYFPAVTKVSSAHDERWTLRGEGGDDWEFVLPSPPAVSDSAMARSISLVYAVLTASCDRLRNYGKSMHAVGNSTVLWATNASDATEDQRLYSAFRDYWPESVILTLRADVEYLASKPPEAARNWHREVEEWCASFWTDDENEAQSALESVLSLPMWGKRHEMYSAWVVCIIAAAFSERRLQFEVVNGQLSFPFKATKIASFEDREGQVELWAEVRSAASGELSHGRKRGVQPDYRFLRLGQAVADADMAIEVKHYRSPAAARHGDTAKDYARALPRAKVAVVAHGPIGNTAIGRVDSEDQLRVSFHENVRSLVSNESINLMMELTRAFPAGPLVQDITIEQFNLDDAELRLVERHQSGTGTILRRGGSIHSVEPLTEAEVILEIVCHPERRHTIDQASPRVAITYTDGEVRLFEAVQPILSASWHVGTLRARSFTVSGSAIESADQSDR